MVIQWAMVCGRHLFLLFVLLSANVIFGQEQYDGAYALDEGHAGTAVFQYRMAGGDTLYDGPFRFSSSRIDTTTEGTTVHGVEIFGRYDSGLKTDHWTFSAKTFRELQAPRVKGYQVVKNASGEEYAVSGLFHEGRAHGDWQVLQQTVEDGAPADTLFRSRVTLRDGHFSGAFEGHLGATAFVGSFDDQGHMDGQWTVLHELAGGQRMEEHRAYRQGVLERHWFSRDGRTVDLEHLGLDLTVDGPDERWEEHPVDERYFRILTISHFGMDAASTQHMGIPPGSSSSFVDRSNAILMDALTGFHHHEGLSYWDLLPGSGPIGMGKVRLRRHPFSPGEQEQLSAAGEAMDRTRAMIDAFFSDPQVDVGRHAYEEVARCLAVMEVYRDKAAGLAKAISILADPAFEYIDRAAVLPYITPDIHYPGSVTYAFEDSQRSSAHDFPAPLVAEAADMEAIHAQVTGMRDKVEAVIARVDVVLEKYKQEVQLAGKEERMIAKRDSIRALFGNVMGREDFNRFHSSVADAMSAMASEKFKAYAAMALEAKASQIDDVLACYREALDLYELLTTLPLRLERIDEVYTRTIWNPYTYTFMEERMKERVYRAYESVMLPYLEEQLRQSVACGRMGPAGHYYVALYQRMLDLREQDTKELERALRRENDPQRVMDLLELTDRPTRISE